MHTPSGDSETSSAAGPNYSIIIPTHNSVKYIEATVRSCLMQTIDDLEVIVVDDGSTDGTADLVESMRPEDPRVKLIQCPPCSGGAARNVGAAQAKGGLLTFLDSDDLLMPGYLSGVTEALAAEPDAAFVYTPEWVFDDPPRRIRRGGRWRFAPPEPLPEGNQAIIRELVDGNFISGVRTVRREAFSEIGGYFGEIYFVEDWDLWLRLLARGWGVARTSEPLVILRERQDGLHTNIPEMISAEAVVLGRLAENDDVKPETRALVAARQADLERQIIKSRRPTTMARRLLRVSFVRVRRRIRPWSFWYRDPPRDVATALRDLEGV